MKQYLPCLSLLGFFSSNVAVAQSQVPPPNLSQETINHLIPASRGETIKDIQVRFIDGNGNLTTGRTQPDIIIREFKLQPGDVYDVKLAEIGLRAVRDLNIIDRAGITLKSLSKGNEAVMVVTVREKNPFFLAFGLTLPPPAALQGPVKPTTVSAMSNSATGISGGVSFGWQNLSGKNQALSLGVEGGRQKVGFNLGYRNFFRHDRGIGINFFNQQGVEPEFDEGERDINLPNGDDPWIHRLGGGVEYFQSLGQDFEGAWGISYQRVSARDGAFSSNIEAQDELGNQLTKSDRGQDDLLTLNFAAVLERQDNPDNPTQGYLIQVGSDQSIPVGDAAIIYNRLAINYSQYLPFPLFGFAQGDRTLVFNLQGGTILGDLPPYQAFILGGSSSVRGYGTGELGTGRSFIQTTLEYRYPMAGFSAFNNQIDLGGTVFVDYATDLGSGDDVIGQPAIVRDKPGDGFGYGLGLRAMTPLAVVRLEFALNDQGDNQVIFAIGDRF